MAEATLSARNQIVIPREAREALGVKPGDKILVVVRGKQVLTLQKPESLFIRRFVAWVGEPIPKITSIRNAKVGGRLARISSAATLDRARRKHFRLSPGN